MATRSDITDSIFQNEDRTLQFTVYQSDGTTAQDVTGWVTQWFIVGDDSTDAPTDEVQRVTFGIAAGAATDPTGGTFTLTYSGQTTAGIAYNAAASAVQSALEALSNIAVGDVEVTKAGQGDYSVTFQGALSGTDVTAMTASGASLTGPGSPYSVTVATTTVGDGGLLSYFGTVNDGPSGRIDVDIVASDTQAMQAREYTYYFRRVDEGSRRVLAYGKVSLKRQP